MKWMPAYTRDIPASSAAAKMWSKERGANPLASLAWSTNGTFVPTKASSVASAAADWPECAETYSGKGGVGSTVVHAGSMTRWMYVTGRIRLYSYFADQMAVN